MKAWKQDDQNNLCLAVADTSGPKCFTLDWSRLIFPVRKNEPNPNRLTPWRHRFHCFTLAGKEQFSAGKQCSGSFHQQQKREKPWFYSFVTS
jgi:hypothetical protein